MTKRLTVLPGLLLITPFMLLSIFAVLLGHAVGEQPAGLDTASNCRLPCWNDIHPGRTPLGEAAHILLEAGYVLENEGDSSRFRNVFIYTSLRPSTGGICRVGVGRGRTVVPIVSALTLQFCQGMSLGHLVDRLGVPDSILPIVSLINYSQGQVAVIMGDPMCQRPLTPHTPLLFMSLTPPVSTPQNSILLAEQVGNKDSTSTNLPWRGFIPLWRYGQFFPGKVVC